MWNVGKSHMVTIGVLKVTFLWWGGIGVGINVVGAEDRSNFKGKQMQSHTPKKGFQTNDVFFQKEHPWVFDVCA